MSNTEFPQILLEWYEANARTLPWIGIKDPYKIWLSEIILQQTRVEQGRPYYEKFIKEYPVIEELADAPEQEVMKLWEGLGYYSRARNLHATAKHISQERGGDFPNTYDDILQLKGVGPYTAAAIASFAYDLAHAVVDGNVYRILSRYFGIETPIDTTQGKKEFAQLANELLAKDKAATYNQAIMDFASTQCRPANPDCQACPMNAQCYAFAHQKVSDLPVKSKKIKRKDRFFHYLYIVDKTKIYLHQRTQKDIWQNLYQFPLIECDKMHVNQKKLAKTPEWKAIFGDQKVKVQHISKPYKQTLTHLNVHACFYEITHELKDSNFIKIEGQNIEQYAFPKTITNYLKDKALI